MATRPSGHMQAFDIAVVGAGPAGAWAAYHLARGGARVALIDPSHPREKPCGGGVTGRALAQVAQAVDAAQLPCVRVERATFRDRAGRTVDVPLASSVHDALIVASRAVFDTALVAAACDAGAVRIAARVAQLTTARTGFLLATDRGEFIASRLVGADGANSLVRRRLARPFSRAQLSIATGYYAHGVTGPAIVLQMTEDPPGYIWSFPRPDHLAIGICAQADAGTSAGELRDRVRRWITEAGIAPATGLAAATGKPCPTLVPYSWPIPSLSAADLETMAVSGDRWLLAGDAAGLVDPITREGIYYALESGRLAAEALLAGGDAGRAYADALHGSLLGELGRAARLKSGFFRPRFTRVLLDALAASEPIRQITADLVAGTQPYRTLKWRLAATLELGLAWRALTSAR